MCFEREQKLKELDLSSIANTERTYKDKYIHRLEKTNDRLLKQIEFLIQIIRKMENR